MKKIKFIRKIIALLFLFTVSSCSNDWLEIENPNSTLLDLSFHRMMIL